MSAPDTRATWTDCLAENAHLRAEVAGLPLELERRTKHLRGEVEELHAILREHLAEIKALQAEYVKEDCYECDGTGCQLDEVADPGGPHDLDEPTHVEIVECGRCYGTGKRWLT